MYEYGLHEHRQRDAEAAAAAFVAYLREVADRRGRPRDNDLVSDLVAASDAGVRLTEDEVVGTAVLLLMAGHEATVNVVGNGVLALLRHPQEWRRVVADPGLTVPAAEEMIRFDSSLQLFERTATQDVELADIMVRKGQKVAALLGAANRDPGGRSLIRTASTRAGRPNPHLGFGAGIHFCLGAPLARVEVQAVLAALRTRLPDLRWPVRPGAVRSSSSVA